MELYNQLKVVSTFASCTNQHTTKVCRRVCLPEHTANNATKLIDTEVMVILKVIL